MYSKMFLARKKETFTSYNVPQLTENINTLQTLSILHFINFCSRCTSLVQRCMYGDSVRKLEYIVYGCSFTIVKQIDRLIVFVFIQSRLIPIEL